MSKAIPYGTTLLVRDTCLCLHVQRAARALARRFDDVFRSLNLTNGQFSLLMALNRPAPAGMGSVADLLGMDRTTLTAALKRLEAGGLVTVLIDPADRRGRLLRLTEAGRDRLAAAIPLWRELHARLEAETAVTGVGPDALRGALTGLVRGQPPSPLDADAAKTGRNAA